MSITKIPTSTGIQLAARIDGEPSAPPLVLLHALGETSESWAPLRPEFAEHYRVIALDLRGHGDSDWPGEYSTELNRDDVISAIDSMGIGAFTLIGHSLGGAVALQIAQLAPDRITRLVIEDAVPPYPREPRPVPERPEEELPFDWALIGPTYAGMTDPEMREWPALASITAPALAVAGGATSHIPADRIAQMAEMIPDCTVVTIDAGHHVHDSSPDEFARAVLGWLAG